MKKLWAIFFSTKIVCKMEKDTFSSTFFQLILFEEQNETENYNWDHYIHGVQKKLSAN